MKFFFENADQDTVQFEMEHKTLRIEKKDCEAVEEQFESVEAMSSFFRAQIEVLIKDGFSQRLLPEDKISPPPVATFYYESAFFEELKNAFSVDPVESEGLLKHLEQERGLKLSKHLRSFIAFRDIYPFTPFNFGEFSFSKPDCTHSSFEDTVIADQENTESFQMIKNLVGAVELGKKGKDTYLAVRHEYSPERSEVWLFSNEDAAPHHAVAADIPTFFYANHLLNTSRSGRDLDEIANQFKPMNDRVVCESLSENIGVSSEYLSDSKDEFPYVFNRSYWISHLLRSDDDFSLEEIADTFHMDVHTPQVWEKVRKFRFIRETPTTQLYWLWRLFWFNRSEELEECIQLATESPSRFVHSAIGLIEEFESGRKKIGKIEDVHALRKKWVALGLDPALSEKNLQDQADADDKIEEDLAMAHNAIKALSDTELYQKAWGYTDQRNVMEVWLEHLRHHDEISSDRLDLLESQMH